MGASMNILVVAPCTGSKNWKGAQLDFATLQKLHETGAAIDAQGLPRIPAARLYAGLSHRRMMQGIEAYRAAGAGRVKLYIVSAGMGIVEENEPIWPYEATFTALRGADRIRWAETLGIPQRMADIMAHPADLRIVLLGREYLEATRIFALSCPAPTVVLAAPSAADLVPPGALHVKLGQMHAARFHHTLVALKGELVRRALGAAARRLQQGEDPRALSAWRDSGAFLQMCEEEP